MTYFEEWRTIATLIRSLAKAGEIYARFRQVNSSDTYGSAKALRKRCAVVLSNLENFSAVHAATMPPKARQSINSFVREHAGLIISEANNDALRYQMETALVMLTALEAEVSFLLADYQEDLRARSERAFAHLQRSLIVDNDLKARWKTAFDVGETHCEKLGSVHLLSHGIFAFKVEAGERTDLVFQDHLRDVGSIQRYSEGLVLTEWKVARTNSEAPCKFREAMIQAALYSHGALGGSELTRQRYLVVVSEARVTCPDDLLEGDITYRHVNIAVDPDRPSDQARGRTRRRPPPPQPV